MNVKTNKKEPLIHPEHLLQNGGSYPVDNGVINLKFKFHFTKTYGYYYHSELVIDGIKYKRFFDKDEEMNAMLKELNKIVNDGKYREQFKA